MYLLPSQRKLDQDWTKLGLQNTSSRSLELTLNSIFYYSINLDHSLLNPEPKAATVG